MHSLFSRSRTNSTPKKPQVDEFGALPSPQQKKSKKKQPLTPPEPTLPDNSFLPTHLDRPRDEFGGFVPPKDTEYGYLSYERHVVLGIDHAACLTEVLTNELLTRGGMSTPFIFSSLALDISSSAVRRLIKTFIEACKEGIGSAHAPMSKAERRWREEARFAGPHELGMCLRWGLARVVRIQSGQEVRGLLSWDAYREFRDSEAAHNYPTSHFATLLPPMVLPLRTILLSIMSVLSRLTANSTSSGHTPPTLSTLFGPLLFGLTGPGANPGMRHQTFQETYAHYLEAVNATEHLLLAFIRWQDAPGARSGPGNSTPNDFDHHMRSFASGSAATALGVPTRLKEWIKGYPGMLQTVSQPGARGNLQARRGARTVRVVSVRRNVRVYTKDLVRSGATWGYVPASLAHKPGSSGAFASSREWQRVAPATMKLPPKYSDTYKKRMDMGANVVPEHAPGSSSMVASPSTSPSLASSTSSYLSASSTLDGMGHREGDDRFRSLTDLKWGEFESMGFGGLGSEDERKLQFDLTEGARLARSQKRQTLSWNDFSSAGFSRTDVPLSATLQFSTPLTSSVASFPESNSELNRKLRKAQQQSNKGMPPFVWDMEPVLGGEEVVEEGFVDVFCDLVWGTGWMEFELARLDAEVQVANASGGGNSRETEWAFLDRDCNWALVEYKSLPHSNTPSASPSTIALSVAFSSSASNSSSSAAKDPRTSTTLFLFEEFIPREYRQKLRAALGSGRRRLPSLFSSSTSSSLGSSAKSKLKTPSTSMNGRSPPVTSPKIPSPKEMEFEGLLRGGATTKMMSLGSSAPAKPVVSSLPSTPNERSATPKAKPNEDTPPLPSSNNKKPLFRLPGGLPISPNGGGHRKVAYLPAEYSSVDFETRFASYSDDDHNSSNGHGTAATSHRDPELEAEKQRRRASRDDAWVDILVATHNRRMGGQDAEIKLGLNDRERRRRARDLEPDPELASLEVAQVLANVQLGRSMSPDEEFERQYAGGYSDMHDGLADAEDDDVVEIETVPRAGSEPPKHDDQDTLKYASSNEPEPTMDPVLDEDQDSPVLPRRRSTGLGYFDSHPDRRRATITEDDPPAGLAYDYESDEEPAGDVSSPSGAEDSLLVPNNLRPLPKVPLPSTPLPEADTFAEPFPSPYAPGSAKFDTPKTPNKQATSVNGLGKGNGNVAEPVSLSAEPSPKVMPSGKVSAVLEMYRERERSVSPNPVGSPKPAGASPSPPFVTPPTQLSRLPVRVSSIAKELPVPNVTPPPPLPPPQPAVVPKTISLPPDIVASPPRLHVEETGRDSPGRYVHGAPLHNVLEEPEEED